MNYQLIFDGMYPGFFQNAGITEMTEDRIFTELVMDLRKQIPRKPPFDCPEGISFGEYHREIGALRKAVGQVNENWVQYFNENTPVFCAFDRDSIAAFCILSNWGRHEDLLIGGPGCVGTIPEHRKKGIGLELVRQATNLLREKEFDLSWIHFTHLEQWYQKLGYQTVLKWNSKGIIYPPVSNPSVTG